MKNRPTVFIGSSAEGLHIAEAVQILLDRYAEVTLWSQGVFELNKGYLESLNDSLDNFDFAILVLTADDLTRSRKTESPSPRDNVLFELGLFMGRLGRDRCFFVYDETQNIKLPTDLMGVNTATYAPHESGNLESALGSTCTRIRRVITSLGSRQQPLNTSRPESGTNPHNTVGRFLNSGSQNNLDSTEQPTGQDNPTELSVKAPWYRPLVSQWKLVVVLILSGILLGLLLARALTYFSLPSGSSTVNMDPPRPAPSVTPYSSGEKDQNVVQPSQPGEYEGYWLEKYKDGKNDVYAIAKIQYNPVTRNLEFSGTSYDKNLSIVGRWHSVQAHFEKGQYDYLFEGESFNPGPTKKGGLRKGAGGIFFDTNAHGKGHFLSMKDDREPRSLELFKILDEDAARLAGQAPTELVRKLYADPGYFGRVTSVR